MPYSLSRYKVEDYAKWKPVFDQLTDHRRARGGAKRMILFQDVDDPNEITVLIEWDDIEIPRKLMQSDDLEKFLKERGTVKRESYLLNELEHIKLEHIK